jgi:hypothetical protein
MTALIIAIAGCIIFAAFIVGLVGWLWGDLHSPSEDEPFDDPRNFGEAPCVTHSDNGDFMGWVHGEPDTTNIINL